MNDELRGRAIHRAIDGIETDITEGVQALYDLVISSMDWGSGFWTAEDAAPVSLIGHLLGFAEIERVDAYIAERSHEWEASRWRYEHPEAAPVDPKPLLSGISMAGLIGRGEPPPPHDHVLSSVGRCMWPRCSYHDQ